MDLGSSSSSSSSSNPTNKCFTLEQQRLSGSKLEEILFTYIFPPICIFGIIGNTLNLIVFFGSTMKSRFAINIHLTRAKILLSCLAVCDICFLLLMVPHSMANFSSFAQSYLFRWFYLTTKIHLITFANWNSAIATW
ncbi:unnamed protein product [Thelazia callipaeda]|uniref:G_PROTEIN_RECEP_F1_2 domain-containing protein n=1 Tax=Thelazia callipaeda TaxID=103827 RepID=A0A0N5CS93_THECL|nr:unnamed protein product [Thelazia callipaeda]